MNTWTHLAVTYDKTTVRLYVNGTQVSSLAATGAIASSTNPLSIGSDAIWGQYFSGLIDDVRVYNTALTAAQIQTDMTTPVAPPAPDTTPPSAPGTLTATAISSSRVDLSWGAASDNVGVTGYHIERCQGAGCTSFAEIGTSAHHQLQRHHRRCRHQLQLPRPRQRRRPQPRPLLQHRHRHNPQPGHDAAVGAGHVDRDRDQQQPRRSQLGRGQRQRRRDRLPHRTLPGRRLHQLRRDRHLSDHQLQRHHRRRRHQLQLPRARQRRRPQPRPLLQHRHRHDTGAQRADAGGCLRV